MNLTRNSIAAFLLLSTVSEGVVGQCWEDPACVSGTKVTGCTSDFRAGQSITFCCPPGNSYTSVDPTVTCPWPNDSSKAVAEDVTETDAAETDAAETEVTNVYGGDNCCYESSFCIGTKYTCTAKYREGQDIPVCCELLSEKCLYDPMLTCDFEAAASAALAMTLTGVAAMVTVAFASL